MTSTEDAIKKAFGARVDLSSTDAALAKAFDVPVSAQAFDWGSFGWGLLGGAIIAGAAGGVLWYYTAGPMMAVQAGTGLVQRVTALLPH